MTIIIGSFSKLEEKLTKNVFKNAKIQEIMFSFFTKSISIIVKNYYLKTIKYRIRDFKWNLLLFASIVWYNFSHNGKIFLLFTSFMLKT